MPRLSIIIPAYNAGAFLRQAVDSVLAEPEADLEIIVVDDGSTDGSLETIKGLPVRVLRQGNAGEAATRNAGLRAATGRFVSFLDADDLLTPGSLVTRAAFLQACSSEWAIGGLPEALIDETGANLAQVFEPMSIRYQFPLRLSHSFYREGGFFPVSCSLYVYRIEAFERFGGFDESLPDAPDCDFHYRLLASSEIPVLKIPAYVRRLHPNNLSVRRDGLAGLSFRPRLIAAVNEINRRHGMRVADFSPWELDYLRSDYVSSSNA